jgi:hypothetical protein
VALLNQDEFLAAHASPHHARWLRRAAKFALAVVLVLLAVWLVLFITKGQFLRPWFERIASARAHRQVQVSGEFNLYFDPVDVAFRADGLSIANVAWAPHADLVDARHLALRIRTSSLLWGKTVISQATIDGARLALQWDAAHEHNTWTFDPAGPPAGMSALPDIERGLITDTHVDYADPRSQLVLHVDIRPIVAVHSQIGRALGFSGTGLLRKQPARFAGRIDQPDQTLQSRPSQVVLHAQGADTTIDLSGQMPGISNPGAGQYHVVARGANMADLFDFMGVVAVPTRRYHVAADVARTDGNWVFAGMRGTFGDSDIAGRLAVGTRDDRLHLDADLHTASLDWLDAAPVLGYDPQRLDRMGTKGLVTRENGHPRILPDAPLRSADLRRFDADVHYRVGAISAKSFPVGQIDLTLRLDHGVLTLRPLSAVVAGGQLDSAFVIDTRGPDVKADYQVHLHPTSLGKLLARFGVNQSGTTGTMSARVAMSGVGNSLRQNLAHASGRMTAIIPAGTLSARNIQLAELDIGTFVQRMFQKKLNDPVEINCALVAFTVGNGMATADPVLIDTRKNIITGTGDFSFRDESVNLQVKAKAKTFSLFSLQSPVRVGGDLAQPRLKVISPQLLARIGVGGALALAAGPLGALVAFVDPGDGKATACGPVLAGAGAAAQHTTRGRPVRGLQRRKP